MTLYEYLRGLPEESPAWLDRFSEGDRFSRQHFFASRVVYYPGSGTDGHPVRVFGSTHSAHSFVYADYGVTQAALETELRHPNHGFRGYHTLARLQLVESDLVPAGWTAHIRAGIAPQGRGQLPRIDVGLFGFLEILERDVNLDDDHGARRLAILFLGADGMAAYDALFCQRLGHSVPFAVVLQDHGFGGNYDRFGRGGLLERLARDSDIVPRWLLVAENTSAWHGFPQVPDVEGDRGGMSAHLRFLHERRKEWRGSGDEGPPNNRSIGESC